MSWYETAFRKEYLDLYYHRNDEAAKAEAEFATKALGLAAGSAILDVCCGAGRHARALTGLGHHVVGIDLSRDLLAAAESVTRVRADMRALPFWGNFDAATSFFTSFGYFDDDGNQATLDAVANSLRPGGAFLLDYLNAAAVKAHLVPESEEERNGTVFKIRRRIEGGRVLKEVDTGAGRYTESVRLYLHVDLVERLRDAGLNPVATYGGFDGRDYTTDSARCIMVARKV
jgi:SAM-dependent methyltransferase